MGTDLRLVINGKKVGEGHDICIAHVGRKWPFTHEGGHLETDQDKIWPRVNEIETEMKKRASFLVGYSPHNINEAQNILQDLELDIAGWVEELVNHGQAILLAKILHDSAGYIKTEDA